MKKAKMSFWLRSISVLLVLAMTVSILPAWTWADSGKLPFDDVVENAWYADAVSFVYYKGLMKGISETKFSPNGLTTRAMLVTVLYRIEGSPEVSGKQFDDVEKNSWYDSAVIWCRNNEIVNGYSETKFGPNDNITREQLATIAYRFVSFKGYDVSLRSDLSAFEDGANVSTWAKEEMSWAVAVGLVKGVGGSLLSYQSDATRAEIATILLRLETEVLPGLDPDTSDETVSPEIALLFGVDPNESDSDNDGLSKYVEIYITGTDPTLKDTDGNGVLDADEDADKDGLTNAQEVALGTELSKADSDNDGIDDYKEVKESKTDPCKYDTDGDGLCDGDELVLGLDPLKQKTDGKTLDSKREFTQEIAEENIEEALKDENNAAVPSLVLTTNGNVNNRISLTETESNDFSDSRAIVGTPVDVNGDNLGEGKISFTFKSEAETFSVRDIGSTFNTNLICKYNEDGTTDYLETEYDSDENKVTADVNGEGTYFVLDVKNLFDELGLSMPEVAKVDELADPEPIVAYSMKADAPSQNNNANNGDREMPSSGVVKEYVAKTESASADTEKVTTRAASGAMAQADIVFVIDTTGSMGDEIYNVKENVQYFVDVLREKGISAGLALIDYQDLEADGYDSTRVHKNGSSNWFYDVDAYKAAIAELEPGWGGDTPECAVDALETARLLDMRASAGKIFILITDADYKVDNRYGIPSMAAEIELLKNAGVTCAVVSPSYEMDTYYDLYNETDGIWADIYGDFYSELMTLADKIGTDIVGDGYWIYLEGPVPVPVRLDEEPKEGSTADTDKDGVYDIVELEGIEPTGSVDLDELITMVSQGVITGTDYGTVMTYKYNSNPITPDTDFDGIDDFLDESPRNNVFAGSMYGHLNLKSANYIMDYRNFFESNTYYNSEIASSSLIFANNIYSGGSFKYSDSGKKISNISDLMKLHGLSEIRDFKLNTKYTDDDVSEVGIGYRDVAHDGKTLRIVAVTIRGTNGTTAEWSSNFDMGKPSEWSSDYHKGFYVTEERIREYLDDYVTDLDSS
ncbi:MAG: S-layer homology domain-containing protein, partial [Clostridia bacterium]|nr:S-layer homology domain-containing protein [Clostridia bacterium]